MHIPSENGGKRGENKIWDSENVSKRVKTCENKGKHGENTMKTTYAW